MTMDLVKDVRAAVTFAPDKMKKVNLFDTPRMFCDVYGLQPGQAQTAHAHAGSDKVYFVLDGEGTFLVGDAERTVAAGHAILAPAGVRHSVRNPGPKPLSLLVLMAPKPA
jgi:mannose-6-phosphate isomerase-like protein (cupin superfamily)